MNRARRCLTSVIEPTPMIQRRIPYILAIISAEIHCMQIENNKVVQA